MNKLDYKFKDIEVVNLEDLVDHETSGTLLKAYAIIPPGDGPSSGDETTGGTGCDSTMGIC